MFCLLVNGRLMGEDRLNTREMLIRRNCLVSNGSSCILCDSGALEDRCHLFIDCPFTLHCWYKLGIQWNHKISFMELSVAMACTLRSKETNYFDNVAPSFDSWRFLFCSLCLGLLWIQCVTSLWVLRSLENSTYNIKSYQFSVHRL